MSVEEGAATLDGVAQEQLRRWKAQRKALAAIREGIAKQEVGRLHDGLTAFEPTAWRAVGQIEAAETLVREGRATLVALRSEQLRRFTRELEAAATAAGRPFRRLGETPPEFRLAPFSVVLDVERMEATLRYAREDLGQVPARAPAILAAADKAQKQLDKRQLAPEEVFDLLLVAYRAVLGTRGRPLGERVDLADVLPLAAFLRQSTRFRGDPVRERFASYSKAAFLYDLGRIQGARLLERGGFRLDLGTATGDSVRQKKRVFYLERPGGDGQYYLSLRFVGGRR